STVAAPPAIYTLSLHDALPILDYTGDGLNAGSKVVFAAVGRKKRELAKELPPALALPRPFNKVKLALPGIVVAEGADFTSYENEDRKSTRLNSSHVKISYAVVC